MKPSDLDRPTRDVRAARRRLLVGAALTPLLFVAACGEDAPSGDGDVINLAATTGMIGDLVKAVLGDQAGFKLTTLMGSGVDPHSYRETRADVETLLNAKAVFWNGLYLEAQLEQLMNKLSQDKPVVAAAEAAPVEARRAHDDYEGRYDPHIWMDPTLWKMALGAVQKGLSDLAPDRAEAFASNAAAYEEELAALDAYSRKILATVPKERRVLVTAHDAFGYFGKAYGFEVIGVQGVSTESEAGLARIAELVDLLVKRQTPAVFVESSVSPRNMRALLEGAQQRGLNVTLGAELFSDAMGAAGTYEGAYLGMIDHNVTAITRALGGVAPEKGRLGKLGATA